MRASKGSQNRDPKLTAWAPDQPQPARRAKWRGSVVFFQGSGRARARSLNSVRYFGSPPKPPKMTSQMACQNDLPNGFPK